MIQLNMINLKYVAPVPKELILIAILLLIGLLVYAITDIVINILKGDFKKSILSIIVITIIAPLIFYTHINAENHKNPAYYVYIGSQDSDSKEDIKISKDKYLFIKKVKERYVLGEKIQNKEIDKIKKIIKQ